MNFYQQDNERKRKQFEALLEEEEKKKPTKRPWAPRTRKVLPQVKMNYRGKNPAGGRKAVFSQSSEYRPGFVSHAVPWGMDLSHRVREE